MIRILAGLTALFLASWAFAQSVPNHAVPVGRGPGVTGFNSVGPCGAGFIPQYTGSTSDPSCQSALKYRLESGTRAAFVMDDFDRSDRALNGDIAPTGQAWALTGTGQASSGIVNGSYVAANDTTNTYAALDYGATLPRVSGTFSFGPTNTGTSLANTGVTLIADQEQLGLNNMLHLISGPTSWTLQKRVGGGSFVGIGTGTLALATDGTVYNVAMEIDVAAHTATVLAPDGSTTVITDAAIGTTIVPRYATIQLGVSTGGYASAWHSLTAGYSTAQALRAEGRGAATEDVTFLRGNTGTFIQRSSFVTPATVDWYRIATQTTFSSIVMIGHVKISSIDSATAQQLEFNVAAASGGTPYLSQEFSAQNNVFNQVRLSTDAGGQLIGLDIHLNAARAATVNVEFEGFFTPVIAPVAGATVLPTANTIITATPAAPGLTVTKTVRASGGAADCTLIFTGGLLSGGSC